MSEYDTIPYNNFVVGYLEDDDKVSRPIESLKIKSCTILSMVPYGSK